MKSKRKKGIKAIIIVVILFVLFNILWFANYGYVYFKYASKVEYYEVTETYHETDQETGVTYAITFPSYPSFTSNVFLNTSNGDFIIYPKLFGGCEICYTNDNNEMSVWFDEDMQLIEKYSDGTIDENREDIERLLDLAYDKWGLEVNEKK